MIELYPPGLREFIDDVVDDLTSKFKVEKPFIGVGFYDEGYLEERIPAIWLPRLTGEWWKVDRKVAEDFVRYTIAHEFKHYLQFLEGKTLPKIGPFRRWKRRPLLEIEADAFAEAYSGISRERWGEIVKDLMKKLGWWLTFQTPSVPKEWFCEVKS